VTTPPRIALKKAPPAPAGSADVVSEVLGATAPQAPESAQPPAAAQDAATPPKRGPGRPPTRKERYEPFSTKISITLRDQLDAEVARVKGTDQEVSIVTAVEEGLKLWLASRQ
jgi:hypothetical protein